MIASYPAAGHTVYVNKHAHKEAETLVSYLAFCWLGVWFNRKPSVNGDNLKQKTFQGCRRRPCKKEHSESESRHTARRRSREKTERTAKHQCTNKVALWTIDSKLTATISWRNAYPHCFIHCFGQTLTITLTWPQAQSQHVALKVRVVLTLSYNSLSL